jgi:hypothetical protein
MFYVPLDQYGRKIIEFFLIFFMTGGTIFKYTGTNK